MPFATATACPTPQKAAHARSNHSTAAPSMKSLSASSAVQRGIDVAAHVARHRAEVCEWHSGDRCHHASWGSEATVRLGAAVGERATAFEAAGTRGLPHPAPRRVRPAALQQRQL